MEDRKTEGLVNVVRIEVDADRAAFAAKALEKLADLVPALMKLADKISGDLAAKEGVPLAEVIRDAEESMHIGAAACRFMAGLMEEAESDD